jgi:hypothetical protein
MTKPCKKKSKPKQKKGKEMAGDICLFFLLVFSLSSPLLAHKVKKCSTSCATANKQTSKQEKKICHSLPELCPGL